jgi:hypothetical protein
MTTRSRAIAAAAVITLLVVGCSKALPTLDEWVATNAVPAEKVLCTREENGEFFFIALASHDRVRLGSRLDLGGYTSAYEFSIAWRIGNETSDYIVAKIRPTSIVQRSVKSRSRVFADNVEYQTLKTADSKVLRVSVTIHKCRAWSPSAKTCDGGATDYTVKVCEATL